MHSPIKVVTCGTGDAAGYGVVEILSHDLVQDDQELLLCGHQLAAPVEGNVGLERVVLVVAKLVRVDVLQMAHDEVRQTVYALIHLVQQPHRVLVAYAGRHRAQLDVDVLAQQELPKGRACKLRRRKFNSLTMKLDN